MTWVQLANRALMKIGARRITSLTEDNKGARACNEYYSLAMDEILAEHDWACATERQSLATLASDNLTIYNYKYQLPQDPYCIRPIELIDEDYGQSDPPHPWLREGRIIYSDLENAVLVYIGRPADPTSFDIHFMEAVATQLAYLICIDVTGDVARANAMVGLTALAVHKAIGFDQGTGSDLNIDQGESTELWIEAGVE